MYQCTYFGLYELVPEVIYLERGDKAWELFDDRLLITLDRLRERYGLMIINNWYWGGNRQWSGIRIPGSPNYTPFSQHTFGRAADCLFENTTAEKVRQDILANPDEPDFEHIQSLELEVSWLHFDVRNCERIKTYTP